MAREAVIHRVNPYLLHGEQYYEILYSYTNEPDTLRQSRIAHTNIYSEPQEVTRYLSRRSSTSSWRSKRRDD